MTKKERARELFSEGYNCAQSVAGAFCEEVGLPLEVCVRLTSGFGGGMGRLREVCGACTGMFFVLSAVGGYDDAADTEGKKKLYEDVRAAADAFRAKNGSIVCRELLGGAPAGGAPEKRTESYYKKRPCADLVGDAAEILEQLLQQKRGGDQ